MTNKEMKTEGLKMTVKLLGKYLFWKKTKWIMMDHVYAVSVPKYRA